jgi:hypothetical protein
MDHPNYILLQIAFGILTLGCYGIVLRELKKALNKTNFPEPKKRRLFARTLVALMVWILFISILSIMGFFSDFSGFPPKIGIVLVVPLVTILFITFSRTLKQIVQSIPPQNLIRLQTFRIAVELLLWALFLQNLLPIQMTYEGRNFDVLTGITAPIIAFLITRTASRKLIIVWNVLGLSLLINIVGIALLSLPTPFRVFMNEPANTIVAVFPFVWLPGLLVPLAYGLHFFSLRQTLAQKP